MKSTKKATAKQSTTSKVSVSKTRTGEVLPPDLSDKLKDMSDTALTVYVKQRVGPYARMNQELRAALTEMKSRYKEKKMWHKKLLQCGIKPGTWRQWEFRQLRQLTAGKSAGQKKGKSKAKAKTKAPVVELTPKLLTILRWASSKLSIFDDSISGQEREYAIYVWKKLTEGIPTKTLNDELSKSESITGVIDLTPNREAAPAHERTA